MSAEYRLDIYNTSGVKVAEVTDFLSLEYTRYVNAPGLLRFSLRGDHQSIDELEHNSLVSVYRRDTRAGAGWREEFCGFFRGQRRKYTEYEIFEALCPGVLTLLSGRIVAWRAGTANRSSFSEVAAETVAKTLVRYNAGAEATAANGRVRDGAISGLTVEADGGRGNVISIGCAWQNLLEALQKVSLIGAGDFDLVRTSGANLEFRWYPGQRGDDHGQDVLFSLERGNMADPVYELMRLEEQTVAVVGGQGDGANREIVVCYGADYSADNDIEVFGNGSSATTTAGLQDFGERLLQEKRARGRFDFSVVQTPGCAYGVHYDLGDLVRAQYHTIAVTQKIIQVSVALEREGGERIALEMQTV